MQIITAFANQHYTYRSMSTGILIRGGLIAAIYQRSLRLTSRARSTLPNGQLVNHISTDVSRIDFCAGYFHAVRPFHLAFFRLLKSTLNRYGLVLSSCWFALPC
jgi:hypothetical protein